ncbi:MAG: hypothetical protein ABI693_03660 [Bryobacteraceae bacterium]
MRALLPIFIVLSSLAARADFSYEQSTKVTGGAMAGMMKMAGAMSKQVREAGQSLVMVKGDRMAHITGDHGQIIDLSAETITDVNFAKKTYSVMTFAQMADAMKAMMARMHQDQTEDVNFKIDLKDTGESKTIQEYTTHQMLLTLTGVIKDKKSGREGEMKIVSDMWLAKDIKGYDQVREFYRRMAAKMSFMPGGMNAGMMQPGMMQGMSEVAKQAAKMDGVPVVQITRIGDTGVAAAEGQAGTAAPAPSSSDVAAAAIAGRLGRLGGLGGFGRKKKTEDAPPPAEQPKPEDAKAAPAATGALMEMTTELKSFSTASVDASKLQVPAGFQQVESEMLKHTREK